MAGLLTPCLLWQVMLLNTPIYQGMDVELYVPGDLLSRYYAFTAPVHLFVCADNSGERSGIAVRSLRGCGGVAMVSPRDCGGAAAGLGRGCYGIAT